MRTQGRHLQAPWCWGEWEGLGGPAKDRMRWKKLEECDSHPALITTLSILGLVRQMTGNPLTVFTWVTSSDLQQKETLVSTWRQEASWAALGLKEGKGRRGHRKPTDTELTSLVTHACKEASTCRADTGETCLWNGSYWFLCLKTTHTSNSVYPTQKGRRYKNKIIAKVISNHSCFFSTPGLSSVPAFSMKQK